MVNRFLYFTIVLVLGITMISNGQSKVQAKLGILVSSENNTFTRLKSKDRLKAGDKFRVFVQPLSVSYVYVIFTDDKEATLLTADYLNKKILKEKLLVLPSETEFYEFDNLLASCRIAIICDSEKNKQIEKLFQAKQSIQKEEWTAFEEKFANAVNKDLNDISDKPIQIAGNVRGENEEFLNKLQLFTGTGKLIKTYDIEVKK